MQLCCLHSTTHTRKILINTPVTIDYIQYKHTEPGLGLPKYSLVIIEVNQIMLSIKMDISNSKRNLEFTCFEHCLQIINLRKQYVSDQPWVQSYTSYLFLCCQRKLLCGMVCFSTPLCRPLWSSYSHLMEMLVP